MGHGTTVALNMLLERRAKPIGLITTKGFRDVLEIGRQTRPNLYNYEEFYDLLFLHLGPYLAIPGPQAWSKVSLLSIPISKHSDI